MQQTCEDDEDDEEETSSFVPYFYPQITQITPIILTWV